MPVVSLICSMYCVSWVYLLLLLRRTVGDGGGGTAAVHIVTAAAAAVCCITLHCGWASSFLTMIGRKEEELRLRLSRFPLLRRTFTLHTVHCSYLNVGTRQIFIFSIYLAVVLKFLGLEWKVGNQIFYICHLKSIDAMFWLSILHLPNSIQLHIEYLCWCPKITMSFYVTRGKLLGHQQRCFCRFRAE